MPSDTFRRGVQFVPGQPSPLRELWAAVAASGRPLVMHNGLVDLLFIWRSFFAPLPASYSEWLSAFTATFAGGVFDTKCLAEYAARDDATYLQHMYHTACMRHAVPMTGTDLGATVEGVLGTLPPPPTAPISACTQYARHGHCKHGVRCPHSHDVAFLVGRTSAPQPNAPPEVAAANLSHSAGFDAFATAYVFASLQQRLGAEAVAARRNHVYLMWTNKPLLLIKSQYE